MTFTEQLQLALDADLWVGVHGNGLSRIAMVEPGSAAIELWPNHPYNANYHRFANVYRLTSRKFTSESALKLLHYVSAGSANAQLHCSSCSFPVNLFRRSGIRLVCGAHVSDCVPGTARVPNVNEAFVPCACFRFVFSHSHRFWREDSQRRMAEVTLQLSDSTPSRLSRAQRRCGMPT